MNDDLSWSLAALELVKNHLKSEGRKETDDPATCDTMIWNVRCAADSTRRALAALSETAFTMPTELQPHEELIQLAEKLSGETPAHWTSGEKKALLGFLNLHIGHHLTRAK